ncbi:hypothetical protein [Campylobacter hyointestinalis]|uniref:hypothetical protein n=1 Tax=Campylobacter hyointestinalis TaxID=198 RepID=UPI0015E24652|nr:hypothetical protein [Campylobacter hyointestinalis]
MKINLQGSIYLALCILLWSFIPIFAKFAGTSLDHHQYLFYSSIVSFASLLVVLIFSKSIKSVFSYKFSTYVFFIFSWIFRLFLLSSFYILDTKDQMV